MPNFMSQFTSTMDGAETISLGCDVEFFGAKNGNIIPLSPQLIPGTKKKPFEIGDYASLQLDNVLGEITFPPAYDRHSFATYVHRAKDEVRDYLAARDIEPIYKPHHMFHPSELMSDHAQTIGCEPDYAADVNDPVNGPDMDEFKQLRTSSGHIHIGVNRPISPDEIIQRVRALDFAITAPLILMGGPDGSRRRTLYGQAGRFRFKDYGFEYRTPDSWWFGQDEFRSLPNLIYKYIASTMGVSMESSAWGWINANHSHMAKAINEGDKDRIHTYLNSYPLYKLCKPSKSSEQAYETMASNYMNLHNTATTGWLHDEEPEYEHDEDYDPESGM